MLMAYTMVYAQSSSLIMGARAMGFGYASTLLQDEWSVMNNIGGLASIQSSTASFSFHSYPGFKPFNRVACVIASPLGSHGVIGGGIYRFGDELYHEQVASIGFGSRFGLASLGIKVNYIQYHAEGYGTAGAFTMNFGGIAKLSKKVSVGAYMTNINQPVITRDGESETVPARMALGLGFHPSDKALIAAEVEKDLDHKSVFKLGTEYQFYKKFVARSGFNLNPDAAFVGVGFKPRVLHLDYALQYHLQLGVSHQASVSYKLSRK